MTLAELPVEARSEVADLWLGRARSELAVGTQFELLTAGFATEPIRASLTLAASDEARHSAICAAVAAQYSGGESPSLERTPIQPLARFGDTSERTSLLLHLVLLSCVNEGTSTFYLRECMKRCRDPAAHAALRDLLADDVRHARIGWAHLGSAHVGDEDLHHVSRALPTLLRLSHEAWSTVPERREPWFAAHGCLGRDAATRAFESAVREVILPALSVVGVDPKPAKEWAARTLAPP